ncbi:MobA/MobL family protein [Sphingomonas sp. RB1R13]|uniref:MobA/MobL family protein n=1 Tax=Sphingomonas sp. RB1R13 TaxID=3096159 RepID=UPI002FCC6DD5
MSPGAAGRGARYSAGERGGYLVSDRTQVNEIGNIELISNIDTDVEKCIEFFDAVERCERNPSVDQVEIDFDKSRWLWRKVVDHPACDPAIIAAYRQNPDGEAVVQLCRGGMALQDIIRECDFRPPVKPRNQVARDRADGIKWRLGRGGRTQWRVVVSFPSEFSAAQRVEALELICARFLALNCMYMAVIHEPSAKNDRRNAHCHIDIYDRPCRRLNGIEKDDLANVSARWIDDVREDYRAGKFDKDKRRWDFEVIRECTYASGNKRPQKVFRQNKSEPMRAYSVPKESRRDIALIINKIAIRDFGRVLVDHRRNEERGIDKKPDRPLGPDAHALERRGFAAEIGLRNEQNHAEAARKEIAKLYNNRMTELDVAQVALAGQTMDAMLLGARFRERKAAAEGFQIARSLAAKKRDAASLQLEIDRNLSSAYLAIKTNLRVVRHGEDRHGKHATIVNAARRYWREWVAAHPDDVSCLKELKTSIKELEKGPDLQLLIDRASDPLSAEERADLHFRRLPKLPILPTRRMQSMLRQSAAEPQAPSKFESLAPQSPRLPAAAVPQSDNIVQTVVTQPAFKSSVVPPLVRSPKSPAPRVVPPLVASAKTQTEKPGVVGADGAISPSLVPPEALLSWASKMERFTRLSLEIDAADRSRSHGSPAQAPAEGIANPRSSLGRELAQKLANGPDPELNYISTPTERPSQAAETSKEISANPAVTREINPGPLNVAPKDDSPSIISSTSHQVNRPGPVDLDTQVFVEGGGRGSELVNRSSVDAGGLTEPVAPAGLDRQEVDSAAWIVKGMLDAFVKRLEERNVLLIEKDGVVLAAPDQELERGDPALIGQRQLALRAVKARQDLIALEVAKDLWTNRELLAAGRTNALDRMTLELMEKWPIHPNIAWAVAHIEPPLLAERTQPEIVVEAAKAEPQQASVSEPLLLCHNFISAKTTEERLKTAAAIRRSPAALKLIGSSAKEAWEAEQIRFVHAQRDGAGGSGGIGG